MIGLLQFGTGMGSGISLPIEASGLLLLERLALERLVGFATAEPVGAGVPARLRTGRVAAWCGVARVRLCSLAARPTLALAERRTGTAVELAGTVVVSVEPATELCAELALPAGAGAEVVLVEPPAPVEPLIGVFGALGAGAWTGWLGGLGVVRTGVEGAGA